MKSFSSRTFFWEERGEKLMTCHLFLDNFLRFYDLWVVFKGLRVFRNGFLFQENSSISVLISWDVRLFWIVSFAKDVFVTENWLCFRACNSRIVTYDQEFVMWCDFRVSVTITESFCLEKFPWRNHGVVENMCSFSKSYL